MVDLKRKPGIEEMLGEIERLASSLVSATNRSAEYASLSGESSDEVYRYVRARLGAAAMPVCRDLKALARHEHDWNDNDYCDVCGADGRA